MPLALSGLTGDQLEQVGQGSYLVNAMADCNGCHTADPSKFLAGGAQFSSAAPQFPFNVTTRNLTPDPTTGLPANIHSADEFVQVIRTGADLHGVADGGAPTQSLIVMPWTVFRWMSEADIRAIYAYLKVIPPVSNAIPADTKPAIPPTPFPATFTDGDWGATPPMLPPELDTRGKAIPDPGNLLRGLAVNPLKEISVPSDPGQQATFARGAYIVAAIADCSGCHTNNPIDGFPHMNPPSYLTGGQVFLTPPPLQPVVHTVRAASANLIGGTNGFFNGTVAASGHPVDFPTFVTAITQGVHADDPPPQAPLAWPMPWMVFRNMTLPDLQAVYDYMNLAAGSFGKTATAMHDTNIPMAAIYCDAMNACPTGFACSAASGAGECLLQACTKDADCAVCQTCDTTAKKCAAPAATAACLTTGY